VEARSPPVSMTDKVIGSAEACPCAATAAAAKKVAASRRAAPIRIVGMFALLPVSRAFAQLSFICKVQLLRVATPMSSHGSDEAADAVRARDVERRVRQRSKPARMR